MNYFEKSSYLQLAHNVARQRGMHTMMEAASSGLHSSIQTCRRPSCVNGWDPAIGTTCLRQVLACRPGRRRYSSAAW